MDDDFKDPFDLTEDVTDDESTDVSDGHDEADQGQTDEGALREELEALKREHAQARIAADQQRAKAQLDEREQALTSQEQALTAQRRKALEEDDLEAFDRVDAELTEVRFTRQALAQQRTQPPARDPADDVVPAAKAWVEKNPRFNTDQAFRQKVLEVNKTLQDEGYNLAHPRFYQELDRRLNPPKQRSGDVAGVARGSASSGRPTSQTRLTEADLKSMARYNMNPNSPEHRRAWAKRNAPLS